MDDRCAQPLVEMGSCELFWWGWACTAVLLISVPLVAGNTDVTMPSFEYYLYLI
jgi:hypothetical protein